MINPDKIKITLLKNSNVNRVVSVFYKGSHTNLVEMTRDGENPFFMSYSEFIEAAKHGLGKLIKDGVICAESIFLSKEEKPVPSEDHKKAPVIPEPKSVIKNDTKVIEEQEQVIEEPVIKPSADGETGVVTETVVRRSNRRRGK